MPTCKFCQGPTDTRGRCTNSKATAARRAASTRRPTRLTVHVFDNHGIYQGSVVRSNRNPKRGAPLVRVAKLERECQDVSGKGWSVWLGEKARLPADLKRAAGTPPEHWA